MNTTPKQNTSPFTEAGKAAGEMCCPPSISPVSATDTATEWMRGLDRWGSMEIAMHIRKGPGE